MNHLAHFLLTHLLVPTLLSSSRSSWASRVINLTSGAHLRLPAIDFSNPSLRGCYIPRQAYAQSKTANILHANELEARYGSHGLHALSVHPGLIFTGLQNHDDPAYLEQVKAQVGSLMKSLGQGAATTVWGAVGKVWEGKGGVYLEDCREAEVKESLDSMAGGVHPLVFDKEAQRKLWEISCEMVGVKDEV